MVLIVQRGCCAGKRTPIAVILLIKLSIKKEAVSPQTVFWEGVQTKWQSGYTRLNSSSKEMVSRIVYPVMMYRRVSLRV